MFNRLKKLGDVLEKECVSKETKLKEFYIKNGYKITKEIKDKTDGVLYYLLELEK